MITELIAALKFGLSIWSSKEKTKYLDELLELERRWLNEFKKGYGSYSNASLDEFELELRLFSSRVFTAAGIPNV